MQVLGGLLHGQEVPRYVFVALSAVLSVAMVHILSSIAREPFVRRDEETFEQGNRDLVSEEGVWEP